MHGRPLFPRLTSHFGHPIRVSVCLGGRAGDLMFGPMLFLAVFAAVLDVVAWAGFQRDFGATANGE